MYGNRTLVPKLLLKPKVATRYTSNDIFKTLFGVHAQVTFFARGGAVVTTDSFSGTLSDGQGDPLEWWGWDCQFFIFFRARRSRSMYDEQFFGYPF